MPSLNDFTYFLSGLFLSNFFNCSYSSFSTWNSSLTDGLYLIWYGSLLIRPKSSLVSFPAANSKIKSSISSPTDTVRSLTLNILRSIWVSESCFIMGLLYGLVLIGSEGNFSGLKSFSNVSWEMTLCLNIKKFVNRACLILNRSSSYCMKWKSNCSSWIILPLPLKSPAQIIWRNDGSSSINLFFSFA